MRLSTMLKTSTIAAALLFGLAMPARAQAASVAWTAPIEAQTTAEAAGYIYTLYVNRLAPTPGPVNVLTGVVCTSSAPGVFNCTAPIPAGLVLVVGQRWELTAKTATSSESGFSLPFLLSPSAPTNLKRQ